MRCIIGVEVEEGLGIVYSKERYGFVKGVGLEWGSGVNLYRFLWVLSI